MIQKYSVKNKNFFKHRSYYQKLPPHIIFLPDGNRRYARKNKISDMEVYEMAKNSCLNLLDVSFNDFEIKTVSLFILRPSSFDKQARTIKNLEAVIKKSNELAKAIMNGETNINPEDICIEAVSLAGKKWMALPNRCKGSSNLTKLWIELTDTIKKGKKNNYKYKVIFLLNYSGKEELDVGLKTGKVQISEQAGLAIRTGDGMRLSDCPLYAMSEAHFYLIEKYLPEVNKINFRKAIEKYYLPKS